MSRRATRAERRRRVANARPVDATPSPSAVERGLAAAVLLAGPLLVATTAAGMLAWTWRTWPDPIVDFGREVYLAWQLAQGKSLYVDVAHFSGPLSASLNATWFRLFGPGIMTLALCNVALTGGFVALLYALLVRMASRLAATAACITFVVLFACGQYTRMSNFNWVCPYSHELPHGVMLTTVALACLERYQRTRHMPWMGGVGLAAGLLVLTKAEVLLAGGLAIAVGIALTMAAERPPSRRVLGLLAAVVGAAALPLIATVVGFVRVMPLADVLAWPLGHWRAAARSTLVTTAYYREGSGLDDIPGSLAKLATAVLWYGLVLGSATAGAFVLRRVRTGRTAVVLGAFVVTAGLLGWFVSIFAWAGVIRGVPFAIGVLAVASFAAFVRRRAEPEAAFVLALRTAFVVFAGVLLAKMILNARVYHYGFVLLAPAAVVLVVGAVEWLPAAVDRRGGEGGLVRAVALGALAAALWAHAVYEQTLLAAKIHVVGEGRDAFYADDRGVQIAQLLHEIQRRVGPRETLVVLPEGAMLNYLARRSNPTPYYLFDATSRGLWGDETITRALETHPPDWIVLVDRGEAHTLFGKDYLQPLSGWIQTHYGAVWQRGTPFARAQSSVLSLVLMRRTDGA